ncbi:MAG TPA: prolyl oligopeptidase family serine peptidase [Terriglobales bacterium]|nr:prolyl oligopeptidase family serine peptidase [Terriglobales bacterium]
MFKTRSLTIFTAIVIFAISISAAAQQHLTGTLPDGATYVIDVPAHWNGTLLLYSHGYVVPGNPNPAQDVGDPITGTFLLSAGYALAGTSYATTGWAVHEAIPDQIAVLDVFNGLVGPPTQTIAWGHSLGGMITAGLIQDHPERFTAALPMCGVLSGGVGTWNQGLDGAFAFNTLVAGGALQVVHITNPSQNLGLAEAFLSAAQATPQGRARLALVAALGDTPGWFIPTAPEPPQNDYADREANQFLWFQNVDWPFVFAFRAELEFRAGGNPSWNTGVNYAKQLERSVDRDEVQALYAAAGLDLQADLATLNNAARISADPAAVDYLKQNIIYNGQISMPVLTLHTSGDGLVVVENEQAYASVVRRAHNNPLLRELFVHRAGHCEFSPAETLVAFGALSLRVATGHWPELEPQDLNFVANLLGPQFNVIFVNQAPVPAAPSFFEFEPASFLRPFDAFSK